MSINETNQPIPLVNTNPYLELLPLTFSSNESLQLRILQSVHDAR